MNNTLTGLGLALVLALLAALIGPWFVNWTAYRDDFAKQAAALIGAPVKVGGAVDVRLLPTPYARFRGLSAGAGASALSVDEIEMELAVAPLLRGEFKAERAKLVRPRLGVETMPDGAVRTAFSGGRGGGSADRVSLDRVEIVDGAVTIVSPAGRVAFDHISGTAEVGSLAGPFKFDGAFGVGGSRAQLRLATARMDDKGALRLKLALLREGRPGTLDAEGGLTVAARPVFDGRVAVVNPSGKGDAETWRAEAQVKADPRQLQLTNLDIAYGPDDRAVRLAGRGQATLGARPTIDVALESRQVDVDRLMGGGRASDPATVFRALAERFRGLGWPQVEGRLALDVRGLMLAGDVTRDLKAEIVSDVGGWRVRRLSGVLPGNATLAASGAVAFSGFDPGFSGDVDVSVADLAALRRWLSGSDDVAGPVRNVAVKGKVTAGLAAVSVDDATLTVGGARSRGRVGWRAGEDGAPDRIEAALVSDNLDLDALGVDRLLKSGFLKGGSDVVLALDAKSLTLGGVRMAGVSVDGALQNGALDLKRFDVDDAAGAQVSGAGRLSNGPDGPRGHVSFDVASERMAPLVALARAVGASETVVRAVESRGGALAPLKLEVDVEASENGGKVSVSGDAAGGRVEARFSGKGLAPDAPADIELRLASQDGRRIAGLFGVAVSPAVSAAGGEVLVKATGAIARGMTGEARLKALGVELTAKGAVAHAPVVGVSADLEASLKSPDLTRFGEAVGRATPGAAPRLPADLTAKIALGPDGARIERIDGSVAGAKVRGELSFPYEPSRPFGGRLAFGELPAGAVLSVALPSAGAGGDARSAWSAAPFEPAIARGLTGRLDISAARMPLAGSETAEDARFVLQIRPTGLAIEGFSASLDGGRLAGDVNVMRNADDATVSVTLQLDGVSLDRLAGGVPARSAATGSADVKLEAQATGRSPSALIGALTGSGALAFRNATIRRLDVGAVDRIEPVVESGLALDAPKIAERLDRELASGDLVFDQVSVPFTVSAGVARSGAISAQNATAKLGGGASVDLRRLTLNADLTLQPRRDDAPQIGVGFAGPLAAPRRRIDATGFTGWLSVRAVERETKRIEAMEADIQERARVARLRAEEERKKAEEEKRRQDEERRKAEAERKRREAEIRVLTEPPPRPAPTVAPGLPPTLDLSPPGEGARSNPAPPGGVFAPQSRSAPGRQSGDAFGLPQSILPETVAPPR